MNRYYVFSCMACNKPILVRVEFVEYDNKTCLDFRNHKLLRVFNDEAEAKRFFDLIKNEK